MNFEDLKKNYVEVLKNYSNFKGRARRSEYWLFFFVNVVISIILGIVDGLIGIQILSGIYSLIVLVPGIAVAVRRMHDVEKAWFFILIPFYNLYLLCIEGTKGSNEYGEDPKSNV